MESHEGNTSHIPEGQVNNMLILYLAGSLKQRNIYFWESNIPFNSNAKKHGSARPPRSRHSRRSEKVNTFCFCQICIRHVA